MQISGRALARAADQLDVALRSVDGAQSIPAPLLGRGGARDAVRSVLGEAHDWAASASDELAGAGTAAGDARHAIDELAGTLDAIRYRRDVLDARNGEALRAAVDGAKGWRGGLRTLGAAADALEKGTARQWLTALLREPAISTDDLRAVAALAGDPRVAAPASITAELLRSVSDGTPQVREWARMAMDRGGRAAAGHVVDDLLVRARSGEAVDLRWLERGLRGLDDGAGDGARRLPVWLGTGSSGSATLDAIDVEQIELLRRMPAADELRANVLRLLEQPADQLSASDVTRIAAITELPEHLRGALSAPTLGGRTLADALRAVGVSEPHLHRMWASQFATSADAGTAARSLLESGDVSAETMRRLAALGETWPNAVFGRSGGEAWRASLLADLATVDDPVTAGVFADAIRLLRSGAAPAELRQRTLELLAAPPGPHATRQLAAMALLPDTKRPPLLQGRLDGLLDSLHGRSDALLDDLRWAVEREQLRTAGTKAIDELDGLLHIPDEQLDAEHMQRIRRLSDMSAELGVDLKRGEASWIDDVLDEGWLPVDHDDAQRAVDDLRTTMMRHRLGTDLSLDADSVLADIRTILAKPDDAVTIDDLRRLALIDELPSRLRPGLPEPASHYTRHELLEARALPATDEYAQLELDSLRRWSQQRSMVDDAAVTRETLDAEVHALLAKPDGKVTTADLQRLALLDQLPTSKRPALPDLAEHAFDDIAEQGLLPGRDPDARAAFEAMRWHHQVHRLRSDPAVTARSTFDEVGQILAKEDRQISETDLRRLALLDELPAGNGPDLPEPQGYRVVELYENGWLPRTDSDAQAEFHHLRLWHEQRRLAEDPATTSAAMRGELERILAKPDRSISLGDLRRLAAIDALPARLRPPVPDEATASLRQLYDDRWLPARDAEAKAEFAALREWMERLRLLDAEAAAPGAVGDELARIAFKPTQEVTIDDMRRLAIIAETPQALRGKTEVDAFALRDLYDNAWLPRYDDDAAEELMLLREWAVANTNEGRRLVAERIRAGEAVDPELLRLLADARPGSRASAGLDRRDLVAGAISMLRQVDPDDPDAIHAGLTLTRRLLRGHETDPTTEPLLRTARQLINRNIKRIEGAVDDGYQDYPDHAEIGRAIEQLDLLVKLGDTRVPAPATPKVAAQAVDAPAALPAPPASPASPPAPRAAAADAATAPELLSW